MRVMWAIMAAAALMGCGGWKDTGAEDWTWREACERAVAEVVECDPHAHEVECQGDVPEGERDGVRDYYLCYYDAITAYPYPCGHEQEAEYACDDLLTPPR